MIKDIILVDEDDQETGSESKLIVHQRALRHRAFSVFVFKKNEGQLELLLQQRHSDKYHCGGLWTNTCCGHPRPGEEVAAAGMRRLFEETGLKLDLQHKGVFHYIAKFDNGLTENEVDHVLVGWYSGEFIHPDPHEIATLNWLSVVAIQQELIEKPEQYTPWFAQALIIACQ
ncbi:MAG: isopentenyl-diphosphate delta-isomerase [Gammaproteobacteria bacterium RIFCSPHIGHO2_12_FULL_35_23]|nr:MAG: isopentenyl-diphosphate delta-isomerase [Gammaproteobacteria bacterium RIFCSPHIGHO2_12_FULL_35_23]